MKYGWALEFIIALDAVKIFRLADIDIGGGADLAEVEVYIKVFQIHGHGHDHGDFSAFGQ